MDPHRKGTRKDTPAHVQMPGALWPQIRDIRLETKIEEEKEVIISEDHGLHSQSTPIKETGRANRIRKPTPAYVQGFIGKNPKPKSISFEENLLEEEDEENEKNTRTYIDLCNEKPILRKDTPAARTNPKPARIMSEQDSITEEDENPDDNDQTLVSYRLRKQSILQCSHPSGVSAEEISLKDDH